MATAKSVTNYEDFLQGYTELCQLHGLYFDLTQGNEIGIFTLGKCLPLYFLEATDEEN